MNATDIVKGNFVTNPNGSPPAESQALTPHQARHISYREHIGAEDVGPRAIVPRTFAEAQSFALAIADSSLVPEALKNRAPDVLMIVLAGAELDFPPIRSLSLFHVMDGVPKLTADALAARIRSSPLCDYFEPIEEADTHVTWEGKRVGNRPPLRITYKIADAEKANLIKKTRNGEPNNWMKFPKDMMHARCKSRLAKLIWPDLAAGITTAEEAYDIAQGESVAGGFTAPPTPTPPPATATTSAPAAAKPPKPAKPKPPIDVPSTEPSSTQSSTSSAPTTSPATSPTPSASAAAASPVPTSSSSLAPSATPSSPPPETVTASDAGESTTPAASQPSAPVGDESGFGGEDDAPTGTPAGTPEVTPSSNHAPPLKFEQFKVELANATAKTIDHVKDRWVPWSRQGQEGNAFAKDMRELFAKRKAEIG